MLWRFRNWVRVVLPIDQAGIAVVGLILFLYALAAVAAILGHELRKESSLSSLNTVVLAATIVSAAFRAVYFNPIENRRYGAWLAHSAWDSSLPLPLGPLHLVWQDVAIVLALTLLFPPVIFSRLIVATAFLLVYCMGVAYSQARSGIYWSSYGIAFLSGCFILAIFSPWARFAAAAAMYPVCFLERQWLLGRFPFERERGEPMHSSPHMDERSTILGWPMPPIENLGRRWISHADAALVGATAAWLIFCTAYHFRELDGFVGGMRTALGWTVGAAMIAHLVIYLFGYPPPISLLGRIATGRLIIPRYDVVFIAPLAAGLCACLVDLAATHVGVGALIATPIACGIAIWLSLSLPPRYVDWVYTGGHRVAYRFHVWLLDRSKSANSALERERGS